MTAPFESGALSGVPPLSKGGRIMRNIWRIVLAGLAVAALARTKRVEEPETDVEEIASGLGDDFLFDVAARFNEALIGNIDAVDSALTAILAGVVAVAVFTIDKVRDFSVPDRWVALGLLGGATVACVLGYVVGVAWRGFENRDGVRPIRFIPDFARMADEATAEAIEQLAQACEMNLSIRLRKRLLAILALVLLLIGTAIVAVARLNGKVL
jgi:hypothetical protein